MPVGSGRFFVTTTKTGKKIRLHATPSGAINEAKNLKTGQTHSPEEFAADRVRAEKKRNSYVKHPRPRPGA